MEDSATAYNDLLAMCRTLFPEVGQQVQDEVARGRRIERAQLEKEDREARETRMKEANVGRAIGKDEQAVVPYTDDERLLLLLGALELWVQVSHASRVELRALAKKHALLPTLRISNPDETAPEPSVIEITDDEQGALPQEALRVLAEAVASVRSDA